MDEADLLKRVFLIFIIFNVNKVQSERCITPNGEQAECISIHSCLKLTKGIIVKEDKDAKEFVRRSYCGFDKDPLICCGSEIKSSKLLSYLHQSKLRINFDDKEEDCNSCNTTANLNITSGRTSKTSKNFDFGDNGTNDCNSSAILILNKPGEDDNDGKYCGMQREDGYSRRKEFPWLVLLRYLHGNGSDAGFKCAGTIISGRYVLTAARCIGMESTKGLKLHSVRLNHYDKKCNSDDCTEMEIEDVISRNDLALIRLNISTLNSGYPYPVCLPLLNTKLPKSLTSFTRSENDSGEDYEIFKKINVKSEKCDGFNNNQGKSNLCTIYLHMEEDISKINVGTPLIFPYKRRWYIEGVLSTVDGSKLFSTKISNYLQWILININ